AAADDGGADAWWRGLGAGAVDLQRDGAAVDAALGRGARAVAVPDGGVRRHRAGQLAVGLRRRAWRRAHRTACGGAGHGRLRAARPLDSTGEADRTQPRPAE